jgi:hypothetical protein
MQEDVFISTYSGFLLTFPDLKSEVVNCEKKKLLEVKVDKPLK